MSKKDSETFILSDQEWVTGITSRDEYALQLLWEWLFMLASSSKYKDLPDMARDSVITAYMRILNRGVYQFSSRSKFKWYCATIFANEVRRNLRKNHVVESDLFENSWVSETYLEDEIINIEKSRKIVQECIKSLHEREQLVIEATYLQGLAPEQVARNLSITRTYVNVIATRARKKLKRCLEIKGYTSAEEVLSL